jgi:hypothetical protein
VSTDDQPLPAAAAGDICPETSYGMHCGCYYDPSDRSCCACGQVNWELED